MNAPEIDTEDFCFGCGRENPAGLQLAFRSEQEKTIAEFTASRTHQGFRNVVHGGVIAAVLDEAMVKAVLARNIVAMTADLSVRFKAPLFVGDSAVVESEVRSIGRKLVETSAVLRRAGVLVASARAKMFRYA